jgi:hypothetical protein
VFTLFKEKGKDNGFIITRYPDYDHRRIAISTSRPKFNPAYRIRYSTEQNQR